MLTKICIIEEKPDNPNESMNSMESVDSNPPQIITSQYPDLHRREEELSGYIPTNPQINDRVIPSSGTRWKEVKY
jgi:hypothetical protein